MNTQQLAKRLDGLHTIAMIQQELRISRESAINYVSRLRHAGFVKTLCGSSKNRLYSISPLRMREDGHPDLYETINQYAPVHLQVVARYPHYVHGKQLSNEAALVAAIESGDHRLVLAAMFLFNHVRWKALAHLARSHKAANKVGALYDLARVALRTRRMDARIYAHLHQRAPISFLLKDIHREGDYGAIGKKWGVVIGLRDADIRRLHE